MRRCLGVCVWVSLCHPAPGHTHPRAPMNSLVGRFWVLVDVGFSTDLSVRGTAFACLLACLPASLPVCLPARLPACLRACLLVRPTGCLLACWRGPRMRYPCVCPRRPCNRPDVPRSFQGYACCDTIVWGQAAWPLVKVQSCILHGSHTFMILEERGGKGRRAACAVRRAACGGRRAAGTD